MFELCPLQYKFVYIDHIADQYKTAKPYLTMGAHVHNALNDFYGKLKPEERTLENLESLLRKRWTENRAGFSGVDDERKWGNKALSMLKLYIHKNDVTKTPVSLEDYYDADIAEDAKVLGRIDRVDQEKDGLHVIDYKTGKFDEEEVSDSQLKIYALIMSANLQDDIYKASYLYLPMNQWYTVPIDPDEFSEIQKTILNKIKTIKQEKKFAPCLNKYCKNCDFLEICPKKEEVEDKIREEEMNQQVDVIR